MTLERVELLRVRLPLARAFTTSFGTTTEKEAILVHARMEEGSEGWGECVAAQEPLYSSEWNDGAWAVLRDYLVPSALERRPSAVRGHPMAKAALGTASLDASLRSEGRSLAGHIGAVRDRVPCGVSVGIEQDTQELIGLVAGFVEAGYRRVKLKIEPGRDLAPVAAVREAFPELPLSVDANAAYEPTDSDVLLELDRFDLEYVEQPFGEEHLLAHAELQARIATPVCLDESITSAVRAREAIRLDACRVINVKLGRVGGFDEARTIHDIAVESGIPLWCGGMLETGVGRAANLALAAMPGFTMPGDTSASDRYFRRDLTEPFEMSSDGTIAVPPGPGIGVEPILEILEEIAVDRLQLPA